MCGILGAFSRSGIDEEKFRSALNRLAHRGPDAQGIEPVKQGFLGHRRLSIIDLSPNANQPFKLPSDNRLKITFNGEIYNYKELARQFTNLSTKSDTEIILKGFADKGEEFFRKLRGMYAFAIYDERQWPIVTLYRDPAGIKPMYYFYDGENFIYSSEIKAIIRLLHKSPDWNEAVVRTYLSLGYCPEPFTVYSKIKALEPGAILRFDVNSFQLTKTKLSTYQIAEPDTGLKKNISEKVNSLLEQAVLRNVVSDVPIQFALSGGIDSSLLVAIAAKKGLQPESITVAFDDKTFDETDTAKEFSQTLGIKSDFITCDNAESLPLLRKLLLHFDQPFADSSLVPFYFLSKAAAQRTKVLVGGDGGDEIQGGYSNFITLPRLNKLRPAYPLLSLFATVTPGETRRKLRKATQLLQTANDHEFLFLRESWIYPEMTLAGISPFLFDLSESVELYSSCFEDIKVNSFEDRLLVDTFYKRMLSDYLRKADMMSMLNSLEYRVPMLDEDLVDFSLKIPLHYKVGFRRGKKILREIHSHYYPSKTTNRSKTGFSIPMDRWLSSENFREIEEYLLTGGVIEHFVRREYIKNLFKALRGEGSRHEISRSGVYQQIIILYSLQLWFKEGRV